MTIKQHGGVFGRNPKFNSVEVESLSIAGNAVPDASTILVDGDIGSTVQGYDADTAKYDDATANFTGTLQNGGSNVLVDTDIGSTVQGYDADTAKLDVAQTFTAAQTFNENIVMANTKGIDFSATSDAGGMTSELFDDYEEGTFTSQFYDAATGGNLSSTVGTGSYIKVGRICTITMQRPNISTSGLTAGNNLYFTLPFTASNFAGGTEIASGTVIASYVTYGASDRDLMVAVLANTSRAYFNFNVASNNPRKLLVSELSSGFSDIDVTFTYQTA